VKLIDDIVIQLSAHPGYCLFWICWLLVAWLLIRHEVGRVIEAMRETRWLRG